MKESLQILQYTQHVSTKLPSPSTSSYSSSG